MTDLYVLGIGGGLALVGAVLAAATRAAALLLKPPTAPRPPTRPVSHPRPPWPGGRMRPRT